MLKPKAIFQNRKGKALILEMDDNFLVIVSVADRTTTKHRADYFLSYSCSITAGLTSDTPIRCVPVRISKPAYAKVTGHIDDEAFDEIRALAAAEIATNKSEQHGRAKVSGIYRR